MLKTKAEITAAISELRLAESVCRTHQQTDTKKAAVLYARMADILEWVLSRSDSFQVVLDCCKELRTAAEARAYELEKHKAN